MRIGAVCYVIKVQRTGLSYKLWTVELEFVDLGGDRSTRGRWVDSGRLVLPGPRYILILSGFHPIHLASYLPSFRQQPRLVPGDLPVREKSGSATGGIKSEHRGNPPQTKIFTLAPKEGGATFCLTTSALMNPFGPDVCSISYQEI